MSTMIFISLQPQASNGAQKKYDKRRDKEKGYDFDL